jgi:hypothetical protein
VWHPEWRQGARQASGRKSRNLRNTVLRRAQQVNKNGEVP